METKVGVFLVDPKNGQVVCDSMHNSLPEAMEYMSESKDGWFTLPVHAPLQVKAAAKQQKKAAAEPKNDA